MKKELIATIFFTIAVAFIKFSFHELWKDEWQSWQVSRDLDIIDLFSFLNYEGHPSLWYLWLKPFTFLSGIINEEVLINSSHLILVAGVFYLLFMKFDLPFYFKIILSLSYFFFYEYGIVNRGYILVILLGLLSVYFLKKQNIKYFSIALLLLCQTEVYGVLIAFTLLIYFFLTSGFAQLKPYYFAAIGLFIFVLTVYPRGNADDFGRAYNQNKFTTTNVLNSFQGLTANNFTIGFIDDTATYGYNNFGIILGLITLGLSFFILSQNRKILATWGAAFMAFILFSIIIYTGGVRQWGMLFLTFILILELDSELFKNKIKTGLLALLFAGPFIHNITALKNEINLNFSNAKDAGEFIKNKIPENVAIVTLNKFETAAAGAYAKRPLFELPSGNKFTYFKWLEKIYIPTQSELILFARYKKAKGLIIISSEPVDQKRFPILKLWQKFDQPNIKSEEFYFYIMDISGRN